MEILSGVGNGVPDLMCSINHGKGPITLLEVKDGAKKPSARKLTGPEKEWHSLWHEHVFTVRNLDECMKALNL